METRTAIGLIVLLGSHTFAAIVGASADETWQLQYLNSPSQAQRTSEQNKGKVFIYDGLHDHQIDAALDNQFERIDHMMFTRVKTIIEGVESTLDDGCDD